MFDLAGAHNQMEWSWKTFVHKMNKWINSSDKYFNLPLSEATVLVWAKR